MPIYEFLCDACGTEFEELVSSINASSLTCPNCESIKTTKKFSVFGGVHIKNQKQDACPSASACGVSSSTCASNGCGCPMH